MPRKKTFDCMAFKRKAQARIYRHIKDLTPEEEIAYFDRAVRSGPLADFWRKREQAHARTKEK